jgi:phytoene synthase
VTDTELAYAECGRITRDSASSFYLGMRLMPRARREALYAIYAFARRIDDIADGAGAADERLARLEAVKAAMDSLGAPGTGDLVLLAVADASARFPLQLGCFADLIEGARMDVQGTDYHTFGDLVHYCRCVAGSIGRLTVGVFSPGGVTSQVLALADDLGVALQLTNILRDLDQDLARGRVYIPAQDMRDAGCAVADGRLAGPAAELIAAQAARARTWFDRGMLLLPLLDRHSAVCVGAMAHTYLRVLDRIEHDPLSVLHSEVRLRAWERGWAAAQSMAEALR